MKAPQFEQLFVNGPVGRLDTQMLPSALDGPPRAIALVAHPNPLQGGTNTNKIVHTLAKVFSRKGYEVYCPNLRGVGQSDGEHDHGHGEVDDMAALLAEVRLRHPHLPLTLAGFSFGTFVQAQLCERLGEAAVERLILIAPACAKWHYPHVPASTLVVHGEADEVASLAATLDWARPQSLPIIVAPGVGHFFHGKLTQLADIVSRNVD